MTQEAVAQTEKLQHSTDSAGAHLRLLSGVERIQKQRLWQEGALWGFCTFLTLGLLSLSLAQTAPAFSRALFHASLMLGLGVALGLGLLLSRRRVGNAVRTSRLIAEKIPHLSFDVLSAVELSKEPGASAELTQAFLKSLDEKCAPVSPAQVVSDKPLRYAQAACLASLSLVLFSWALAEDTLRNGLKVAFTFPEAASLAQKEPITGDVELTYRYPAYTGLAQRVVPGTNGEIQAPKGTVVDLKTHADRPVKRADILYEGQRVPLRVEGERELSGTFTLNKTGKYQFVFFARGESPIAEGPLLSVTAEPDSVPTVRVTTPAEETEIDEGQKVTVAWEASDDYGLSSLQLVYRLPGQEEKRVPLSMDEGRRAKGSYLWETTALSLRPGQRVTYFLEVKDNDGVDGPKTGVSRTQTLKLYSAAEQRREAVEKATALWEKLLSHLADRLEGPSLSGQKAPEILSAEKATDESGKALSSEFLDTGRELSNQRDTPEELVAALANISESLKRGVSRTSDARRPFLKASFASENTETSRQRLVASVTAEVTQTEKDVLYLETLLDQQKMKDLRELAEQLSRERRELARLVEEYQKTKNEDTKEAILQDLQKMKAHIADLMKRMSELAKGIRDEHLNQEALMEMMEEQDMSSSLDEVEKLMREGKADEALAKLQELGMEMEQMLENLEAGEEELGSEQFPELAEKFQEFMDELKETAKSQEAVTQQTQALRDRYKNQLKERVKKGGQAIKKELLQKANDVLADYAKIEPSLMNARAEQPLNVAQAELNNLKQALEANDFDLAAEAADRAQQAAEELAAAAESQKSLDEAFRNPPEQLRQSAETAARLEKDAVKVKNINDKLQNLFPKAGQMMSAEDQQKLQQLAQKQRQLEQNADDLKQKMNEMSQMAPVFNEDALQQMAQVENSMGQAASQMEAQDAQRGLGQQKAALEQLQQFQQQMKQSRSGKGKKGGLPLPMFAGKGEGFGQQSRDKVEVPDENQYQAPREFRKDLLDAMKQGSPEKYKEQVKRYYEELVK